jgi:type II secretory ATPase GspE/PulE/Tfp pilus assembly ATPase PilB-like protein
LLNLNADVFAIAASLQSVLAQRLVRKICSDCSVVAPEHALSAFDDVIGRHNIDKSALRIGIGCEACRFTGYRGRLGIYSYLPVTNEVTELILTRAPVSAFNAVAARLGCRSLNTDSRGESALVFARRI